MDDLSSEDEIKEEEIYRSVRSAAARTAGEDQVAEIHLLMQGNANNQQVF